MSMAGLKKRDQTASEFKPLWPLKLDLNYLAALVRPQITLNSTRRTFSARDQAVKRQ